MDTGLGIAQGDATLDGAVYGIYDLEGNRVGEVISKGGEYVTSDYLPSLGTFYLKEENHQLGTNLTKPSIFSILRGRTCIQRLMLRRKLLNVI